jgi:hypothetical protein
MFGWMGGCELSTLFRDFEFALSEEAIGIITPAMVIDLHGNMIMMIHIVRKDVGLWCG